MAIRYTGGVTQEYSLGRGIISFDGDSPELYLKGFRDLGNCTEFTVTLENETKEHQSSLAGLKVTDLEVLQSQKMTVSLTLDELNVNNLGLFFLGDTQGLEAADTVPSTMWNSSTVISTDAVFTDPNVYLVNVGHNIWYDLELRVTALGRLVRAYDFEPQGTQAITVRKNPTTRSATDGTIQTEGTHYELDRKMGRIRILSGANGTDDYSVHWVAPTFLSKGPSGQDNSLEAIASLSHSGKSGRLRFIQENPANANHKTEYLFHNVTLKPEGDFAGIGDEFATITLTGTVSAVGTAPYGISRYMDVVTRRFYSTT